MHVYDWNWLKDSSVHAKANKGLYDNSVIGVSKTSVTLSYHSVASQCTVTISSSNITFVDHIGHAHGSSEVFPQIRCDCLEPCDSEDKPSRLMTPRRRSAWHAKLPPYAMIAWRNVWVWPPLTCLAMVGWRLARNVAYISAVLLEFHLSFMWPATVLSLKFLCKTFVLLLRLPWRTVSSLNWQISPDKLTFFDSQNTLQHKHASALEFAPFASECIAALAETTFYCKGQSIAKCYQCLWGDGQGAGQVSIHISIWKSIKNCFSNSLCTAIVHTLFLEAGCPMKFFTFGIFACTKYKYSILGVARRGWGGMK